MDKISKEQRSRNMARIRSKDTKPKILIRKALYHKGYRYRKNYKELPGKPDIYLSKYNTAIFIHGCFWHGHEGCRYFTVPKTNTAFWTAKITKNYERDKYVLAQLQDLNINVITVLECDIEQDPDKVVTSIINQLESEYQQRPMDQP